MKNAHERFGKLMYRRQTEKTSTNLRVFLDAFVGEDGGKAPPCIGSGRALRRWPLLHSEVPEQPPTHPRPRKRLVGLTANRT
jgi:hypothetical protein